MRDMYYLLHVLFNRIKLIVLFINVFTINAVTIVICN